VFVEEESAEAALSALIPRIVGSSVTYRFHTYAGKQALLKRLPQRLAAYGSWLPDDWRIVVLVDRDRDECHDLKDRMEKAATQAGLGTRQRPGINGRVQVTNRIAVNELEAWLLGDIEALRVAYPRVAADLARKSAYRDPDAVKHGAAEALRLVLKRAGYYDRLGYLPKVEVARCISEHMRPSCNRSGSFRVFRDALLSITTL
jgi:hypothetical protein